MKRKRIIGLSVFVLITQVILFSCTSGNQTEKYTGTPYPDSLHNGGTQTIPGKVQCEYFDLGGEGIAFHESDSINSGSGKLNPANGSYLNEFRIDEAVDISYTKFGDQLIDDNPYNMVDPEADQLYVGWTNPGEWIKYTINVQTTGVYRLGLMYTANQNGQISLSVNDIDVTGPIEIPSTYVKEDSLEWRQWHHWNYIDNIVEMKLKKGVQILTLHTVAAGQMNYESINFQLTDL